MQRDDVSVAIAGVGNLLLMDDGVGIHAVRALAKTPPRGVKVIDVGTSALYAIEELAGMHDVLAIDAVKAEGKPGQVYFFECDDTDEQVSSTHAMGLRTALRQLSPAERPCRFMVLGVEPAQIGYGMQLSRPVEQALPRVVAEANAIVRRWIEDRNNKRRLP